MKKKSGKPTLPEEMSKRVMVPILARLAEEEGNTTALARWLDMSRTGALQLVQGTSKPSMETAVQVAKRLGVGVLELLTGLPVGRMPERIAELEEQVRVLTSSLSRLEEDNKTLRGDLVKAAAELAGVELQQKKTARKQPSPHKSVSLAPKQR